MPTHSKQAIVRALLDEYGQTYAHEAGIRIERGTPAVLFQLACLALLLSAPISAGKATLAAKALVDAKLTTPRKMATATWEQRVAIITDHYKHYDERTSTMLGELAERVLAKYGGDLRKLREAADHDVERECELLQEFKGIGPVGANIFLREVQGVWDEVYPFADNRVLLAARELDLGSDPRSLSKLVDRHEFVRLVAALIRVQLRGDYDRVRAQSS
jgi:endonuclease III